MLSLIILCNNQNLTDWIIVQKFKNFIFRMRQKEKGLEKN